MVLDFEKIIRENNQEIVDNELKCFVKNNAQNFELNLNSNADNSLKFWEKIFGRLELLLTDKYTAYDTFLIYVQAIKILSRISNQIEYLNNQNRISLLLKLVSNFYIDDCFGVVCLESLKCLCNLILQSGPIRIIFLELSASVDIFRYLYELRVETFQESEVPLFMEKLLFLITALLKDSRSQLLSSVNFFYEFTEIVESLTKKLLTDNNDKTENCDNQMYLETCEVLKILFTLTSDDEIKVDELFDRNLLEILKELLIMGKFENDKNSIRNHVIELILNFAIEPVVNKVFGDKEILSILLHMLEIKLDAIEANNEKVSLVSPILSILLRACKFDRTIRKFYRGEILPPLRDFKTRPEQGSTLRNKLCRLLTSPDAMIKELAAEFLFVLCKENVARMIKYTGYGNAAGLLARRGLTMQSNQNSNNYSSDSENSETEEYLENHSKINPVTGCYEEQKSNALDNMTEEQKEYEALKLVRMIDDLMKTGIARPCTLNETGKPEPIKHVLQFQDQHKQ